MNHLAIFIISLGLSLLFTPLAVRVAIGANWFDRPGRHKIHQRKVPYFGGTAIVLATLCCLLVTRLVWSDILSNLDIRLWSIIAGGLILYAVGIYDDLRTASVWLRLAVQCLAGIILVMGGFCIKGIPSLVAGTIQLGVLSVPFTVLWTMFLINAINFIDGLDGLACGIALIASLALFAAALRIGEGFIAFLAVMTVGVMAGFLPYNFHPARIFMGDSGSTFVGFLLAAMTTLGTMKSVAAISLLLPIAALGVPIADTLSSIVRRTWKGQMFYRADKEHVHHMLLSIGFSHRGAVLFLYGVTLFLSLVANLLVLADRRVLALLVILFLALTGIFYRKWRERDQPGGGPAGP
ncbi:MAG TPA: undecaprenyl-phosphate alpha-N-acetylglucosaminyl 1-phosphate transferase [candidate division Zixibacteria bacterium]|jgi:UDP-GlcNAc:undecaprenyl-phosphate GlcNAc-1-phosphate transferase|nr:undecaprenyl-phosphate alpha-N-acetylglucosaminyl 1-phosphate transferase [candidate division Zixibacteria bacterium]